ncbi:MAG: GDP-mannose 4,6-dehydratase [Liquorilactobacillus hordei]|uniref:GDP-mannose 4,6-dehydratase n=1 Tax=Bacteria TaxID=2 RepID=UPI0001B703C5|nr:GDP-mannose 4,6-dehydratase [Zymomonas mobilis]ACV74655.1 NAD-dependent epimerase/dehydratase [Zymomonas mobilis subsp. mobilis NCIMB 11163]
MLQKKNTSLRVLITGQKGFVGKHYLNLLRSNCNNVTIFEDKFDVTNYDLVEKNIVNFQPDVCVHLAGVTSNQAARSAPNHAWNVNLNGTLNIGHAILKCVPECRLIFSSTSEVWGHSFCSEATVDEKTLLAPVNTYSASKAAADLALGALAAEGLKVIRFRPFNHTGPGQDTRFVVPSLASQVVKIKLGLQPPIINVGNLSAKRDFLDVRDVADAYVKATLFNDEIPANIVMPLCSGINRSISDILDELISISGIHVQIKIDNTLLRPVDIPITRGSAKLSSDILGWNPTIPWNKTLKDILSFLSEIYSKSKF